jgi:hypothetical protein
MGNDLKTMTRQPTFGTYVFVCLRTCQRVAKHIRAKFSTAQQRIHLWINSAQKKYFINTEIETTGVNSLFTFDIIHKARSKLRCRFIRIDKEYLFSVLKVTLNKEITPKVKDLPKNFYNIALT